eukprot:686859-Amphidinium_carterae.1
MAPKWAKNRFSTQHTSENPFLYPLYKLGHSFIFGFWGVRGVLSPMSLAQRGATIALCLEARLKPKSPCSVPDAS